MGSAFPLFLQHFFLCPQSLPPPQEGLLQLAELTGFDAINLDFVIAGVGICGTTSLKKNLALHPDIGFTHNMDSFFFAVVQHRLLPTVEMVDQFNRHWSEAVPRPRILGMWNPLLFGSALVRAALLRIPKLLVVMVVCDPVSRLEKYWFTHISCQARRLGQLPQDSWSHDTPC